MLALLDVTHISFYYSFSAETLIANDNEFTGKVEDITFPPTMTLLDLSHNQLSGSVPSNFLDNAPAAVQVDLTDNRITLMDSSVCSNSGWNRGDIAKFGCNGLLCPVKYFSNTGRHSQLGECVYCPSAAYLGLSECPSNEPGAKLWAPIVIGFIVIVGLFVIAATRMKHNREEFHRQQEAEPLEFDEDDEDEEALASDEASSSSYRIT